MKVTTRLQQRRGCLPSLLQVVIRQQLRHSIYSGDKNAGILPKRGPGTALWLTERRDTSVHTQWLKLGSHGPPTLVAMSGLYFVGALLLAFGPSAALFLLFIAKRAQLLIATLAR